MCTKKLFLKKIKSKLSSTCSSNLTPFKLNLRKFVFFRIRAFSTLTTKPNVASVQFTILMRKIDHPTLTVISLVERPPFRPGIAPGSFQNRDRWRATVPVRLDMPTVPVQLGQQSRFLPQTGTNALARHWSRFVAKPGTVGLQFFYFF